MFVVLLQLKALEISFLGWNWFWNSLLIEPKNWQPKQPHIAGILQKPCSANTPVITQAIYSLPKKPNYPARTHSTEDKLYPHLQFTSRTNFPPDSPNPTEFPPVDRLCDQHIWEFRLHRVESQEEVGGGGVGGVSKRKRLCPADAMGVSWLASSETFCLEEKQESLKVCCAERGGSWFCGMCRCRTGRRVPRISFKMTAGLWRFRLTDVK